MKEPRKTMPGRSCRREIRKRRIPMKRSVSEPVAMP